jgi:L-asparaginase II
VRYYEFCLIGGDGSRLSRERHPAADLETVWIRVFRMAELESKRGKRIHVLDDQGGIVISIGAIAAELSAKRARMAWGRLHEA